MNEQDIYGFLAVSLIFIGLPLAAYALWYSATKDFVDVVCGKQPKEAQDDGKD
jgi:hypothetical protein